MTKHLCPLKRDSAQNHSLDITPIILLPRITIDPFRALLSTLRTGDLVRLLDPMDFRCFT